MEQNCMQDGNEVAIKLENLGNALDYYYRDITAWNLITNYVAYYINK